MSNIFTEDFKNTRFILTVLALGLLGFFGIAIIFLIQFHTGDIQEGLMALLTTLLGAIIAIVSVAYNSHFKAREEEATVRADAEKAAAVAANAENAAFKAANAETSAT